eukprot:4382021-Pyramimonas_sp.AAC.1
MALGLLKQLPTTALPLRHRGSLRDAVAQPCAWQRDLRVHELLNRYAARLPLLYTGDIRRSTLGRLYTPCIAMVVTRHSRASAPSGSGRAPRRAATSKPP